MVTYLPRSAWKARAARGSTALVPSEVLNEAFHWPGMAKPINAVGEAGKARVASALRGWQNYHMDGRGWSDIAYQIAIDQEGRAWTLRGINIRSGANGDATVNRKYGAVLLVLGPGEKPSAKMTATAKAVVADYRKRFPKVPVKPTTHSAVRPTGGTDCPGDQARDMINDGQLNAATPPKPKPPVEDEVNLDELMNAQITGKAADGTTKNFGSFRGVLWTLMARTSDDDSRISRVEAAVNKNGEDTVAAINRLSQTVADLAAALPKAP